MLRRLGARALSVAATLLGVAVVVFVAVRLVPGNAVAMMLPPGATEADVERLRALYGLDASIPEQFAIWLGGVARGDLGTSISLGQDVAGLVLDRLPATLELSLLALLLATLLGVALAVLGTLQRGGRTEAGIDAWHGLALATPDFLWGLGLILLFGVVLQWFGISGRVSPQLDLPFATQFYLVESVLRLRLDLTADLLAHMWMPALALALPLSAMIGGLLKAALKDAMQLDYAVLARTKGFSEHAVIWREAMRNAAVPTLTLASVQLTQLIGGTVIVERLFSYGGLGNMAIDAVINRDLPLIQGIVLVFALLFIAINLGVDALAAALNPRLRHG